LPRPVERANLRSMDNSTIRICCEGACTADSHAPAAERLA
jgi:hypothetical protein